MAPLVDQEGHCEICGGDEQVGGRRLLAPLGAVPPLVCRPCYLLWRDEGLTDPVEINSRRDAQRAAPLTTAEPAP